MIMCLGFPYCRHAGHLREGCAIRFAQIEMTVASVVPFMEEALPLPTTSLELLQHARNDGCRRLYIRAESI